MSSLSLLGTGQDETLDTTIGANANGAPHAQANDHVTYARHVVPPEGEIPHNIRNAIVGCTLVGHGVGENVHSDPPLG